MRAPEHTTSGPTASGHTASGPADLLFTGGEVVTADGHFTVAEALAVRDGHIAAVGSADRLRDLIGPRTEVVDLAGRTLLPGINDAHCHAAAHGGSRPPFCLDLGPATTTDLGALLDTVRAAAAETPRGRWIRGAGWDPVSLGGRTPDRSLLDTVAPDRPVALQDFSGHRLCANSAALRAAGLDPAAYPDGMLHEGAQGLIQERIPEPTPDQARQAVRAAVADLNARGITSFTEPGLGPGGAHDFGGFLGPSVLGAYADLAARSELTARVSALLLFSPIGSGSAARITDGLARVRVPETADPRRLRVLGVKIFADGVPAHGTAWMNQGYADGSGHGGLCLHGDSTAEQAAELAAMVRTVHAAGLQAGIHVTGDRAIDAAVEALAAALRELPREEARHYLIHCNFPSASALRTMADLGIGASMNPGLRWLASDMITKILDADHAERAFPLRSALAAGVRTTTGSDAPCVAPDWLRGLSSAMLRDTRSGPSPVGPAERVTLTQAVRSCTATAAWQDHAEDWKGTLEPGKVADLCLLGGSLLRTDPAELPFLPVDLTVVEGEVVHAAG
ncbi:amidohydrolase [Streptomyces sp. NPDC002795]|uniref:amidohydrolase n=1 Tax=Streptomyces sp. NPDC002795 TaxID=3364665 RepID=UPI00367B3167